MSQKNKKDDKKDDKKTEDKKNFSITISFATTMTFCVILLSCLCLSFVFGVIVGRGDNPQAHLPQLKTIMPAQSQDANEQAMAEITKQEVMPKEELNYSNSLKDKLEPTSDTEQALQNLDTPTMQGEASNKAQSNTLPAAQENPNNTFNNQALTDQAEQLLKQVVQEKEVQQAPSIFDFSFQVATFTDEASVDRLRASLEGEGLRTKMEKSGKFYKVMVLMRGTNEQAQDLRKLMVKMKLGEPLQRAKQVVQ